MISGDSFSHVCPSRVPTGRWTLPNRAIQKRACGPRRESTFGSVHKGRKQVHFNPSDLVWFHLRKRKSKLMPLAEGPFHVKEKINENTYKIELRDDYNVSATFNVSDLSLYFEDEEDLDLRANRFKPSGGDVRQNAIQDEAKSNSGLITRSMAKKLAATRPWPITILKCMEIGGQTPDQVK
ncbi:hypothetical protein CRG98_027023 [Punica granatum]|uniref:Tf2-1-like SH3-like domain-containing protein n=1 Tax=Punica granatum TaxID=22663 RepID=A0A2I0J8M3_PUNGR|nr:hypothetical protein CRG98_027023 [Punica granatum]